MAITVNGRYPYGRASVMKAEAMQASVFQSEEGGLIVQIRDENHSGMWMNVFIEHDELTKARAELDSLLED